MISEITCYIAQCNECEEEFSTDSSYSYLIYDTKEKIVEELEAGDWIVDGYECYCNGCLEKWTDVLGIKLRGVWVTMKLAEEWKKKYKRKKD